MRKPAAITREAAAEVFSRCHHAANVDPERVYVRDVMTFPATPAEGDEPATEEETHIQATVKGYTDWYKVGFDAEGKPNADAITKLPF